MAGCGPAKNTPSPAAAPLTAIVSSGPVELTIVADPPIVHLDRDILLTLRVCAPSNTEVRLPPIENRLKGFVLNGSFNRDSKDNDGKPVKEYCFRLAPALADEYRIAPMAITWTNAASGGWLATRPVVFQTAGVSKGIPGATIKEIVPPAWIYPSFRTVGLWVSSVLCLAGAFYLLWRLSRHIQRTIKLRRMSPRERALYELNELLAQDLIDKQKIKEFYLELTLIVRRFIERAHAIRAPEQTTEEFLVAATLNPDFTIEVVMKLRTFLQTADLVKFAAYRPDRAIIDQTLATARDYIETDEKARQAGVET